MKKQFLAILLSLSLLSISGCSSGQALPAPQSQASAFSSSTEASPSQGLIAVDPVYPVSAAEESRVERRQRKQKYAGDEEFLSGLAKFSARSSSLLLTGTETNLCYSPVSLSMALSLTAAGSDGQTQEQLLQALGIAGKNADWLALENAKLFSYLWEDGEESTLQIANSLWVSQVAQPQPEFAQLAAQHFYAATREVPQFDDATAMQISGWISQRTGGLLKPTLKFSPGTLMALVNTVYLKDRWQTIFSPQNTEVGSFTTNTGEQKEAQFMQDTLSYSGIIAQAYTKVDIDLESGNHMLFILPNEGVSIDSLLADPQQIEQMFSLEERPLNVQLHLPKFSFGTELSPIEALKSMGVTDAFLEEKADFSRMLKQPAYISKIQHGTHVSVDEYGVTAAAYTIISPVTGGGNVDQEPPLELWLNRPFLFAIVADNNVPLFTGVLNDPTVT